MNLTSLSSRLITLIRVLVYGTIVVVPFFYLRQGVYPYILSKTLFAQILIEILVFAWIGLAILDARYRPRMNLLLWSLVGYMGIFALNLVFSEDPLRSFWSSQERMTGFFLFLHLGFFALVLASMRKEFNFERILHSSIVASVCVSVLAMLQLVIPNLLLVERIAGRPGATFGNPTFFAGYLVFNIFFALYLLIKEQLEKSQKNAGSKPISLTTWLLLGAFACNVLALFITQTRGDILGFAVGIFSFIAIFAIRPPQFGSKLLRSRKIYIGFIILLFVGSAGFWFTRSSMVWEKVPGLNRFTNLSLSSNEIQPRLIALRAARNGIRERPLRGWGWENFSIVYNKNYDPRALELNYQETRFDKPHNLYAEYLVTGGVPFFLAFLWLMGVLIYTLLHLRSSVYGWLLIPAIVAYLVRSVFIFDTLGPLLMLYLVIGFSAGMRSAEDDISDPCAPKRIQGGAVLVGVLLVGSLIVAYAINIKAMIASYHQYFGFTYFASSKPEKGIVSFNKAIAIKSPWRWNLKRDQAAGFAEAYFNNPTRVSKPAVQAAIRGMEEVAAQHPKDAYNHYILVDMYNQVSDIDPEYYLAGAEREAAIALELSPDRQEVYFSLAKTKSLRSDYPGALKLLDYALNLNPKIPDAHFYYGLIAFASNLPDIGYRELKISMEMGRKWKNANEPRVVGDFFADAGYIEEAIELYKASIALRDDIEAQVKLGIAYYVKGDMDAAREVLFQAMGRFDITKSPSYLQILPILNDLGLSG